MKLVWALAVPLILLYFFAGRYLVLRVALAFLLAEALGSALGVWCAWPIGWTVATGMSLFFYGRGPWGKGAVASR